MELDKAELGRRISERRRNLKMKQQKLAELVGVNSNHISGIEHGKVAPSLDCFVKICNALKSTPDSFLEGAMHSNNVPQDIMDHLRLFPMRISTLFPPSSNSWQIGTPTGEVDKLGELRYNTP